MRNDDPSELELARRLAAAALAALEASRRRIDDLNVYPVPDGDTGTNLTLTARAVVEALERSTATGRAGVARELTRAALLGARGNSGVILSQVVRGAAEALAADDDLARAFRAASDAAYGAVRDPVEGTMLTAARELAEEAEARAGEAPPELLAALVRRGDDCVARTRELLDVLREAGVVDAGAAGLVEIVRGIAAAVRGEPLPPPPPREELAVEAIHRERSRFRYCTGFLVEGDGIDAKAFEAELERLGDSLLVVGDPTAIKVHVHTDDPGAALSAAVRRGGLSGVEIADMHAQAAEREERLTHAPATTTTAAVAVVAGAGNRRLYESLGARTVDGGRTMNPATAEILAAVEAAPAAAVVLLPGSRNVVLAAEQAAGESAKDVRVLPALSLQSGLAAMVAFDAAATADENAAAMGAALAAVATGAVAVASRDLETGGVSVRAGAWVGLVEGEPVAGGESFDEVADAVVERLLAEPREVLTLLRGEAPPPLAPLVERVGERHPDLEVEVHEGGQAHYPLLVSAE